MKKVLFFLAISGMFAFASCTPKPAENQNIVEDTAVVEEVVPQDTAAVQPPAEQTPEKKK